MFLAVVLEIFRAIGIAMIVVVIVVVRIRGRFSDARFVIWEIAKAAPVRDFWKRISTMNEVDMTIVLIEPSRIRNCSRVDLPESVDAMIAAWDEPRPGNREQIGEIRIVAIVGFMISDFLKCTFLVVCFGIIVFCWTEWIRVEVAKSPVRSGRSGFWILRFREDRPRNPARMKIRVAFILDSFSVVIKKIAIQIRNSPIILWMKG